MSEAMTAESLDYPMPRTCPYDPPAGFRRLREQGPVTKVTLPAGGTAWAVTGHAEARALFTDPRISSDATRPGFPHPGGPEGGHDPEAKRAVRTFVEMDEPEHGAHRRLAIPSFTVRQVQSMRPVIEHAAGVLLGDMVSAGSPADLVSAFAVPLPSIMLCHLFGLPEGDHPFFRERADLAVLDKRESGPAFHELREYFIRLAEVPPPGGLFAGLVSGGEGIGLPRSRLADMCVMIVVAGHETSTNMIGLGALALLTHPEQLTRLRADPAAVPWAVEELLRFVSIPETIIRMAIGDIEIGGQVIRAGDAVLLLPAAANRDGSAFPDPDVLDIGRGARHHLAFSYGVHQCLGQNLARLELEIAISAVLTLVPGLRLAVPVEELPVRGPGGLQGVGELPVAW